ncbi:metal ABC transporter permease [Rubellicoccus peritrichatus]|uniref:Metal ABC transporter permease n=1 Tax=Rubellicoccus peritrichatus TaxID=3080537 RepID=A0AAQ3QVL2_9BACT|nr:metal ABC transporter permease [Puniceicoccus sp. CR14]WOO40922.1 metal ABC transporter permease [Puniceicoccus sp. CR14]
MNRIGKSLRLLLPLALVFQPSAHGAKIGDIRDTNAFEQALRFWTFQDVAVQYAVMGSILMGICCGLLGAFLVVRKLSLVGDTLSHAVMPGVALGFLWSATKDPVAIFIGATVAGLIGVGGVNLIKQTTRIKEDSALGMVLAGFYAIGICLFVMIQRMGTGDKSGIDKFLFGQAAALSASDIWLMAGVTLISVIIVAFFYKELLTTSFDAGFAKSSGIAAGFFHYLLMMLLAFAVVVSLQATGIVLVSAMLITPATAAYLLTDRMGWMLVLAMIFGVFSAVLGAFLSFLGNSLPTGPFMVLGASLVFALAFMLGPRHGLVPRRFRERSRRIRIQDENTLKALYHVLERGGFESQVVELAQLANQLNESAPEASQRVEQLTKKHMASISEIRDEKLAGFRKEIALTPTGWQRACEIVRNHRLWELYLTNAADYPADHVHDDAERVEHLLGESTVRAIERKLDFPRKDPHGKLIPSIDDMARNLGQGTSDVSPSGYRQPQT